jgi:tetratricopeptide (TPR) repeat protein
LISESMMSSNMCTEARTRRYIQSISNTPLYVANLCIDAIHDENVLCQHEKLFKEWDIDYKIHFLHALRPYYPLIQNLTRFEDTTSYDDAMCAVNEIFRFHPYQGYKMIKQAIEKNPCNFEIYMWVSECCEISGGRRLDLVKTLRLGLSYCDTEIHNLQRDLQIFPQDYELLTKELNRILGFHFMLKAQLITFSGTFLQKGRIFDREVFFSFHKAMELLQDPYSFTSAAISYIFCPGEDRKKCLEFSLQLIDRALAVCEPKHKNTIQPYAHMVASQSLIMLEKKEKAIEHLDLAISFEPSMFRAYWQRSQLYTQLNKPDFALLDTDKMLQLQPEREVTIAETYYMRAALFSMLKDTEQTMTSLRQAMLCQENNGISHITLMNEAVQENNFQKFRDIVLQIRKLANVTTPSHVAALLFSVSECYAHFNRLLEANRTRSILNNHLKSWYRTD